MFGFQACAWRPSGNAPAIELQKHALGITVTVHQTIVSNGPDDEPPTHIGARPQRCTHAEHDRIKCIEAVTMQRPIIGEGVSPDFTPDSMRCAPAVASTDFAMMKLCC